MFVQWFDRTPSAGGLNLPWGKSPDPRTLATLRPAVIFLSCIFLSHTRKRDLARFLSISRRNDAKHTRFPRSTPTTTTTTTTVTLRLGSGIYSSAASRRKKMVERARPKGAIFRYDGVTLVNLAYRPDPKDC